MAELPFNRILGRKLTGTPGDGQGLFGEAGEFRPSQASPGNQGVLEILWQTTGPETEQVSTTRYVQLQRRNAADSADEGMVATVFAPYAGTYLIMWTIYGMYGSVASQTAEFKIEVTGATTATVQPSVPDQSGSQNAWHFSNNSTAREGSYVMFGRVQLNAGSNVFTPSWKHLGSNSMRQGSEIRHQAVLFSVGGTAAVHFDEVKNVSPTTGSFAVPASPGTPISGTTDGSFTVPAAGWYRLTWAWHGVVFNTLNTLLYYYSIDGGANTLLGQLSCTNGFATNITGNARVFLTAGTHTWSFKVAQVSGAFNISWTTGTSQFLFHVEGGAALARAVDPTPYQMTYVSASSISVAPLQGTTLRTHMNDGQVREHTGTLTWSFTNGVGDLGLDQGSEQASTLYYLYAVPSGAQDFSLRASTAPPTTSGPSGFTSYKYLGWFRNNGSSNIEPFIHDGQDFYYQVRQQVASLGTASLSPTDVSLGTFIPATASQAHLSVNSQRNGSGGGVLSFYYQGQSTELFQEVYIPAGSGEVGIDSFSIPVFGTGTKNTRYGSTGGAYVSQTIYTHGCRDAYVNAGGAVNNASPPPINQGQFTELLNGVTWAAANATLADNTWTGASEWTVTFEAPHDGVYGFLMTLGNVEGVTSSVWVYARMVITGATTVTSQFGNAVNIPQAGDRQGMSGFKAVSLNRGTHTIAFQVAGQNFGGSGQAKLLQTGTDVTLIATRAGGTATIFQQKVSDLGHTTSVTKNDSAFSTVETGITSGNFSVPAGGFYEVELQHQFDLSASDANAQVEYQLLVDGSRVSGGNGVTQSTWQVYGARGGGTDYETTLFIGKDVINIGAGAHTWELKWRVISISAGTVRVGNAPAYFCKFFIRGGAAVSPAVPVHQASATSTSAPTSTTWAGVGTIATLSDEVTSPDITRSGDTLTFARAGIYRLDFHMVYQFSNNVGGVYLVFRARRTSGTPATLLTSPPTHQSTINDFNTADLNGLIQVAAGDQVQIQYAKSGASTLTGWSATTIDSETLAATRLTVQRVGQ